MKQPLAVQACMAVLHVSSLDANAQRGGSIVQYDYQLGVNVFPFGAASLDYSVGVLTVGNIGTTGQVGVEFNVRLPSLQTFDTFANVTEFQVLGIQLLVVPEPKSAVLWTVGLLVAVLPRLRSCRSRQP